LKAGFDSLSLSENDYSDIGESVRSVKVKAVKRK
jgi:hypothetical protein